MNQLTLAEQIFLYELKNDNEDKFEELFIIHNLFNFENKRDIENYIDNTIVHSIYFDISKDYFETNKTDNINEINKPFYFTEEQKNAFVKYMDWMNGYPDMNRDELEEIFLGIYANPVDVKARY